MYLVIHTMGAVKMLGLGKWMTTTRTTPVYCIAKSRVNFGTTAKLIFIANFGTAKAALNKLSISRGVVVKATEGEAETKKSAAATTDQIEIMGVEKQILRAGNGPTPSRGQSVTVHCTGFGKNGDLGAKFWSTKDPGQQPFTFKIGQGQVIKGWDEGVAGMQLGEVARLQCSPDYGYGPNGFPAWGIQPNSVLIFEIEVLSMQ